MAYTSDIPEATDRPNNSQPLLKANFQAIDTVVAINHVAFDDASGDQGKHKWVSFPEQVAAPATAANEAALFSQLSSLSGVTELVFRRESSGTEIEFTSSLQANPGWTRLPSGILIKWVAGEVGAGTNSYNWPTGATIPAFSAIYSAYVTTRTVGATGEDKFVQLTGFSTTAVNLYCSQRTTTNSASVNFNIFAIGI